jgi:hypothetical protein
MAASVATPAFEGISQNTEGIFVFRIHDMHPELVAKDQIGTFYAGDSYVVYVSTKDSRYVVSSA